VRALERLGYVERVPDAADARAVLVRRSARGEQLLRMSAEIFERVRGRWQDELGTARLLDVEESLERILASRGGVRLADLPGWAG
jgi:DNA-binding MarR family transcriptional regulator